MTNIFAGKKIIVGVTGSIAAFKVAGWVSTLAKEEADTTVIMTDAATRFVAPLTFSAVSGNRVYTEMFSDETEDSMAHISLGREADLILIAPATANTIARLAHGFAGNLLETTVLATRARVIICPAMNARMYANRATRDNLKKLEGRGYLIISPDSGTMACKEEGQGRLPEWDRVEDHVARCLSVQDLKNKKILISAGPTREAIDPARFLSNRSSGRMGYALARAAFRRGAEVTLVSGPANLPAPEGVKVVRVESASEMYEAILPTADSQDVIIKAAAVADYRPAVAYPHKVKKGSIDTSLQLEKNRDILLALGARKKEGQILVGFAAESRDLIEEGRKKLKAKNLDLIAVNDIGGEHTGFESETNQIYLLDKQGEEILPFTSKLHTADMILDRVLKILISL
jgi:phosphopantothenoylcysteine decarboxylase/phosphopantothenate--cysteine ligase